MSISRRNFLLDGGLITSALCLHGAPPALGQAREQTTDSIAAKPESPADGFPRQNPKLVEETVGASHGRVERVKELVTAYPELAKSSWDWGFGDWETPIDAASHVGNREIALFLLEHGARPTVFTFAMLGKVEVVKALLAAQPELRKSSGPHGLNLFHHAKAGGEAAIAVRDYFKEIGETEASPPPIAKDVADAIIGKYLAESSGAARFEVLTNKVGLAVQGAGGVPRNLTLLPDGSLHPAGAPSVRFRFEVINGKSKAASVQMGSATIRAIRAS